MKPYWFLETFEFLLCFFFPLRFDKRLKTIEWLIAITYQLSRKESLAFTFFPTVFWPYGLLYNALTIIVNQ